MNSRIDNVSIIIPSFNPTDRLITTVTDLISDGVTDIIVVDDGSKNETKEQFDKIKEFPECTVLAHPENQGKGKALKTAFKYFSENRPNKLGVVTADSDGQHKSKDIIRCANILASVENSLVLGVRDFKSDNVPKRNSFGNRLTARVFKLLYGINIRDTQTGLRGIRVENIPLMLEIRGNRFEYETNMLIEAEQQGIKFIEVEIETVYEEGSNERSHYRPFADSFAIFTRIFIYSMGGVASFGIDIGIFWLILSLHPNSFGAVGIFTCTAIARAISSFFNFSYNRWIVFRRKNNYTGSLIRYYSLVVVQMLISATLVWFLSRYVHQLGFVTFQKVIVDTILFCISYHIQQKWVFKTNVLQHKDKN
ncbi:MAG: bifunctional glycosyltransferase family 2/GtrA family protein [Oscillospiraceae bacterium]|jgi:glycosyltransferase involved in cell wall biosynthesis|nr:bifunctional glycosyltransferase family 2/GtrA family protein [Oscillospiraceae bacterium]